MLVSVSVCLLVGVLVPAHVLVCCKRRAVDSMCLVYVCVPECVCDRVPVCVTVCVCARVFVCQCVCVSV